MRQLVKVRSYYPKAVRQGFVVSYTETRTVIIALLVIFVQYCCESRASGNSAPADADYCTMLARDVAGKEHGFLAGRNMYYVGGQIFWGSDREPETLGFTHPFFHDGRSRGHTLIKNRFGTGHDMWGWEFWRQTRGAYGSVIVNGQVTRHPKPLSMIWRPDRQICRYEVDDVIIDETKFIARNDVVCAMITASKSVTLRFEGSSFVRADPIPTFDGDPPDVPHSQKREATATYVKSDNAVHIIENGTMMGKPDWGTPAVESPMMYSGMSVVISASRDMSASQKIFRDDEDRQCYEFELPCDPSGIVITYTIGDEYSEVIASTKSVLDDPEQALQEKTDWFNDLLNTQIPRFHCSDELVVKTYYYLWSIYFMYFKEPGEGWEKFPHTQTAINNFLGLHLWDSYVYTRLGAWTTDQKRWGQGNALAWSSLVDVKDSDGAMPDNFGIAWYSPVSFRLEGHVEGAWQQYRHSGDREFLAAAYEMYRKVLHSNLAGESSGMIGHSLSAVACLQKMAEALGRTEDVSHWRSEHAKLREAMNRGWEKDTPDFFGSTRIWKDNWELAAMLAPDMPDEWSHRFVDTWVTDSEKGFLSPLGIRVRAHDSVENGVFAVSTISAWQAIEGMFRHGCDEPAVFSTLCHLRGMVRDYGYPIAPECWNPQYKPWYDLHYNWDGAMVLLLLERLAGVHISLPDQALTVEDHLPKEWNFVDVQVPIRHGDNVSWTAIRVERSGTPATATKSIIVRNCPLPNVRIRPWLEGRAIEAIKPDIPAGSAPELEFVNQPDIDVKVELGPVLTAAPLRPWITPRRRVFIDTLQIQCENLDTGSEIRYTLDGSDPDADSPTFTTPISLTNTTSLKLRAFAPQRPTSKVQTVEFAKLVPREPVLATSASPGMRFRIFRGRWERMPDFDQLTPVKTGVAKTISLAPAAEFDEDYAIVFDGLLHVDRDGLYSLHTKSHNTSAVYIGDDRITSIELWKGSIDPWERSGPIALGAGKHPLRVVGIHTKGRKSLMVWMLSQEGQYAEIAPNQLTHTTASRQ